MPVFSIADNYLLVIRRLQAQSHLIDRAVHWSFGCYCGPKFKLSFGDTTNQIPMHYTCIENLSMNFMHPKGRSKVRAKLP